jgi:hypothetical protein
VFEEHRCWDWEVSTANTDEDSSMFTVHYPTRQIDAAMGAAATENSSVYPARAKNSSVFPTGTKESKSSEETCLT